MGLTALLTLGRLPKGLELARCLHQAGHRVLVADPFDLHLSKPSRAVARTFRPPPPATDPRGFLDTLATIAREEAVDLIIPVSEEVMHVAGLHARLPETTRLLCPAFDALLALHDKYEFTRRVTAAGLEAPSTRLGDDPEAGALLAQSGVVVKSRFGCSGAGLHMLEQGDTLAAALATPDWVIQTRVRGREVSTLSYCRDGAVLGHVVYQGLIFSGTVAVAFERIEEPAVDAWVSGFVAASGYEGFVAFDFIIDELGAAWPLECNPRLTSGIHFMDHDDLAAVVTGATLDHFVRHKPEMRFQEGHTALTMAYGDFVKPRAFLRALGVIASARDVLWSSRDPFVFPLMTPMSWPVLRQVMFEGRSFGEAATRDIEWTPAPATPDPSTSPETQVAQRVAERSS